MKFKLIYSNALRISEMLILMMPKLTMNLKKLFLKKADLFALISPELLNKKSLLEKKLVLLLDVF